MSGIHHIYYLYLLHSLKISLWSLWGEHCCPLVVRQRTAAWTSGTCVFSLCQNKLNNTRIYMIRQHPDVTELWPVTLPSNQNLDAERRNELTWGLWICKQGDGENPGDSTPNSCRKSSSSIQNMPHSLYNTGYWWVHLSQHSCQSSCKHDQQKFRSNTGLYTLYYIL